MLTVEQYLDASDMNWNVIRVPVHAYLDVLISDSKISLPADTKNFVAIVREDTKRLLSVKSESYTICQNRDAFDWLNEPLSEGASFQGCDSFNEGRVVTFDIEFSNSTFGEKPIYAILSASNSYDGTTQLSGTSLIYYDGFSFRLGSKLSRITAKHTARSVPRFLEAAKFFDTQSATFFSSLEDFERMANQKLSEAVVERYILNSLQIKSNSLTDRQKVKVEEVKAQCLTGATGGTIWGAFKGVAKHLTSANSEASLKYGIGLKKINKSLDEAINLFNS